MLADTRTQCCRHMADLREYAAAGLKEIMAFAEDMNTYMDTLPDDLKPLAEQMTQCTINLLTRSCIERLTLLSELACQEIAQTALAPQTKSRTRRTEKE